MPRFQADNLAATLRLVDTLRKVDLAAIEAAIPADAAAGDRYAPQFLAALDSERG